MQTNDIVGDIVQVVLKEPEEFAELGLDKPSLFLHVLGVEDLGIWVVHPSYTVTVVNDEEGNPLPEEEQVHKEVDANLMIRWEQISTIVHFPDREGEILDLLVHLERLRRKTEEVFPSARAFVRPGFDEDETCPDALNG